MFKLAFTIGFLFYFFLILFSCQIPPKKLTEDELAKKAYKLSVVSHDYKGAIFCYDELIKQDSSKGEYFYGRGYTYMVMGFHNDEAIFDFERALSLNYRIESCYYCVGLLNAYTNDSIALTYFKKALELNPTDSLFKAGYNKCLNRLKIRKPSQDLKLD